MADALESETVLAPDARAPFFDWMSENWPDAKTVREYVESAHRRELERASQPPVVNVVVAGSPGHYTFDSGSGEAGWSPGPPPEPVAPLSVAEPLCT